VCSNEALESRMPEQKNCKGNGDDIRNNFQRKVLEEESTPVLCADGVNEYHNLE
jgi:hypothetical protein